MKWKSLTCWSGTSKASLATEGKMRDGIRRRPGEARRLTWDFHVPIRKGKVLIKICHNFSPPQPLGFQSCDLTDSIVFSQRTWGREEWDYKFLAIDISFLSLDVCGNTDDGISSEVGIVDPGLVGVWRTYEPPNRHMTLNGVRNTAARVLSSYSPISE